MDNGRVRNCLAVTEKRTSHLAALRSQKLYLLFCLLSFLKILFTVLFTLTSKEFCLLFCLLSRLKLLCQLFCLFLCLKCFAILITLRSKVLCLLFYLLLLLDALLCYSREQTCKLSSNILLRESLIASNVKLILCVLLRPSHRLCLIICYKTSLFHGV